MYCIVGLGNPGKEYENTRHNAGRRGVFAFQKKNDFPDFSENKKFISHISEGKIGREKIVLALPETMMNNSGKAVASIAAFYKIRPEHIIIMHDDSDIAFGKIKISFAKSSGGHRGVESVRKALKTEKFWRIRIGIQPSPKKHVPAMDLVLKTFKPSEIPGLRKLYKKITEALEIFITEDPATAMNQLN